MEKIILIVIALLIHQVSPQFKARDDCINGVKMLTRVKQSEGQYSLHHVCICQIDYWGEYCRPHRSIQCYLTPKSVTPPEINSSNYLQQSMNVTVETRIQCYIMESQRSYVPIPKFLLQRQMREEKLLYSLENVPAGGEIIWANHTQIFDSDGEVKYVQGHNYTIVNEKKRMSQQDEQRIMNGSGPVEFAYRSNFMGVPLSDSNFYVIPQIIRPTQNRILLPQQSLQLENVQKYTKWFNESFTKQAFQNLSKDITLDDLLDDPSRLGDLINQLNGIRDQGNELTKVQFLPSFKITIPVNVVDAVEFHTLRIQVEVKEFYQGSLHVEQTGVNAVEYLVPVKVQGVGEAQVYSINFNQKALPRYVYVLLAGVVFGVVYCVYVWRKKKQRMRNLKIQKDIQEMEEDLAWK